ncbi:winged helix-turn-helix domain-containing protein [Pseudactinotalea sp. Z1732]|uniref:winged helix-turn-helix domain-containing protein n=1 Tax=Micrococcales TaxID=85006 RepID=UPI003C7B0BB8
MSRSALPSRRLTPAQARRIALTAQGLAGAPAQARPAGAVTMRHLQSMINRVGLLQIDSVNVLARAHLLPVLARLGPYDPALLDRATTGSASRPRRLVECFAHEAALVPPSTYQLLRWRMTGPRVSARLASLRLEHPGLLGQIMGLITEHGPATAAQIHAELGHERGPKEHWGWNWTVAKQVLEAAFAAGLLACAHRNRQFERVYDLPERVLPAHLRPEDAPDRAEAMIELVKIAARAHGIGSPRCLADYFRMPVGQTRAAIEHLLAAGTLERVQVHGWDAPLYRYAQAPVPRSVHGRALLAPFDPLVFERRRLRALFGMHYRIGIYTPAHQRTHGYYVLPFLWGEDLVARVDLKADRAAGALVVNHAFAEDGAATPGARAAIAAPLAAELGQVATWSGLGTITVAQGAGGDLTSALIEQL